MEILQKIGIFLIFLGPLVFIHELGHFLVARFFGVRVEKFSIGFGKSLLQFTKGDTEYKFALIPLGGYVKMFGDDPTRKEKLTDEEKKVAFNHKSKFARFWIVLAGPIANFILAYFIYSSLILKGGEVKKFKIAELKETALMSTVGFETGDVIKKLNDEIIYTQEDIFFLDDGSNKFEVERNGEIVEVKTKESVENLLEDYVVNSKYLIESKVFDQNGNSFFLSLQSSEYANKTFNEIRKNYNGIVHLFNNKLKFHSTLQSTPNESLNDLLLRAKYFSHDLKVATVMPDSAASDASLKPDDILISYNDENLHSFYDLPTALKKYEDKEANLGIIRDGQELTLKITPKKVDERFLIGIQSSMKLAQPGVHTLPRRGLVNSLKTGGLKTWKGITKTFEAIMKLFSFNKDVLSSLGGPVAIANMASQSFHIGLEHFFSLMAILSINLGIFNLLPVPVLDGGHIVLLGIEAILGRPLSEKKLMIVQQIGLFLLLSLMAFVIINDFVRFF